MTGIAAASFYVPRYAIAASEYRRATGSSAVRGLKEKAVPGYDEDEATMAVEAGERALAVEPHAAPTSLTLACTGKGVEAATIAEALGLRPGPTVLTANGADAVSRALDHTGKTKEPSLLIASDAPRLGARARNERALGAAAVALLVTTDGAVVPIPRERRSSSKASGVYPGVGDAGAAGPFLTFLDTLATAKKGTSVVLPTRQPLSFEVAAKPRGDLAIGKALRNRILVPYERYVAMRRQGSPPPGTEYSQGAYVSLSAYLHEAKARYRLVAERCAKCGEVQFPPRESCIHCGAGEWEDVPLTRTGNVFAYTIIGKGAAPSEFLEQQTALGAYATAIVALDDGPKVTAMLTDVDPRDVRIGMPVRMVFRRLYTQEGITRYGFKFVPAS